MVLVLWTEEFINLSIIISTRIYKKNFHGDVLFEENKNRHHKNVQIN